MLGIAGEISKPWAMDSVMVGVLKNIVHSDELLEVETRDMSGYSQRYSGYEVLDGTAVISIYGVISKRPGIIQRILQPGPSIPEIEENIRSAMADPAVKRIILDIDSPGGSSDGVLELSDYIYSLRGQKEVVAYANGQMCSAAYWIGSSAKKIYASRGAMVGSIGVYAVVADYTVANGMAGIRREIVQAGASKAAGHPDKPFTQKDRNVIQEEVDTIFDLFVESIARNRGKSIEAVLKVATGDIFIGKVAFEKGLVDGLMTSKSLFRSPASIAKAKGPVAAAVIPVPQAAAKPADQQPPARVAAADSKPTTPLTIEEQCKKEWIADPKIQKEFRSLEVYTGYRKSVSKGWFKEFKPAPSLPPLDKSMTLEQQCKKEWEADPNIQKEFRSLEMYTGYRSGVSKGLIKERI